MCKPATCADRTAPGALGGVARYASAQGLTVPEARRALEKDGATARPDVAGARVQ